ncbi:MAG TPA: hypothetical protein PLV77_09055 [Solirubrobacterales bacterium]|nr:hypothetical protein [Solirubrobacterales bacterium]
MCRGSRSDGMLCCRRARGKRFNRGHEFLNPIGQRLNFKADSTYRSTEVIDGGGVRMSGF